MSIVMPCRRSNECASPFEWVHRYVLETEDQKMANKRPKPEAIVSKVPQVEVLMGQGLPRLDAIRQIALLNKRITAGGSSTVGWV